MNAFTNIVLMGWIPLVLLLFVVLPPRRAVLVGSIAGWLFLPMAGFSIEGLPDLTKMTVTNFGVVLGVVLFDAARVGRFRPSWIDIPIIAFCAVPMASSLSNDLGLYDGATSVWYTTVTWGLPYLIGRLYFSDLEGLRELVIGIFIGGLVYIPLCLYEVRMSPQLHKILYGFHQHSFVQTKRFGGFRPMVFMQHGLAVGFWMTAASLTGFWMWHSRSLRTLFNVPMSWFCTALLVTMLLCKSMNAIVAFVLGASSLWIARLARTRLALICILLIPPTYMFTRVPDIWSGSHLVRIVSYVIDEERAQSINLRLQYEELLIDKALQRPIFGWGGWGRNRVYDDRGEDQTVTDGLWVITFGKKGLIGLCALTAMLLVPLGVLIQRWSIAMWYHPATAPAAVLAVVLGLHMVDNLFNAMVNPIFILGLGGVGGMIAGNREVPVRTDAIIRSGT